MMILSSTFYMLKGLYLARIYVSLNFVKTIKNILRDVYGAIPAVTQRLGFNILCEGPTTFCSLQGQVIVIIIVS